MSDCVLDASAVLALIWGEPGGEKISARSEGAAISAVNHSEVLVKLVDRGSTPSEAAADLHSLRLAVYPFDEGQSAAAAALRPGTRSLGLSFGDRACLSLALQLKLPVLTADRAWKKLKLDLKIEPIR